jgi:1,4-alpha-glucan branching enzyme
MRTFQAGRFPIIHVARSRLSSPAFLSASLIYELHVGAFTAEGTFDSAVERLDHLVDLGVMPPTLSF